MSTVKKKLDTGQVVSDLSESAFFEPASTQVGKPTKYTTHIQPSTIKALKRFAFDHHLKDYEVVEASVLAFLKKVQGQRVIRILQHNPSYSQRSLKTRIYSADRVLL